MSVKRVAALVALGAVMAGSALAKPGNGNSGNVLPNTPAPFVADSNSPVSMVPEAETWALAGVGVVIVGVVAARRRKQK